MEANLGHIYDYSRHLLHTEETPNVLEQSEVKYVPNTENKSSLINNIEYERGSDCDTRSLAASGISRGGSSE